MKKTRLNKKAMFYTISLSLFSLTILLLAALFLRHAESVESRNLELNYFQKNYDLETSVEKVFADAFTSTSGITLSSNNNSLTITRNLPNSLNGLDTLISQLESNIENDFSKINISTEEFLDNHSITLRPLNINTQYENNKIIVNPNQNITKFNIILIFSQDIDSCNPTSVGGGSIEINFWGKFEDNDCTFSQSNLQEANIELTVGSENVLVVLNTTGELSLETDAQADSTIIINFNEIGQKTYFQMPITLQIDDTDFNFYKYSKVDFPYSSE
ncbi:MAG: hypothetical protein ABIG93_04040 [archaeon]